MKIDVNNIPSEGFVLEDNVGALSLDLETDTIKFPEPINIKAEVSKIKNTVSVSLILSAPIRFQCSRCLNDFAVDFSRELKLHYPVDKFKPVIELDDDVRQEIILDYPMQPLCKSGCKGLCPKCGKNLNQGTCKCVID